MLVTLPNAFKDALRILRALRFASQLSFSLAIDTENALFEQAPSLSYVAGERLSVELEGMLFAVKVFVRSS